ncbi:MAG: hypothetical protein V4525_01515 [Pseudomonadota bacterium]
MRQHIRHAFITPFTDPKRAQIYGATSLGLLGFHLSLLTFSYHIAGLGLSSLALFWMVFFGLTGFVLMPGLCWIYGRYGMPKAGLAFFSLLFIGFGLAWGVGNSAPLGLAIAYSCMAMAYWTAYHLSMFTHSSSSNRGNEIAMAYVMMGLGSGVGYVVSGFVLQAGYITFGLALAFTSLALGTSILLRLLKSRRESLLGSYWTEFRKSVLETDRLLRTLAISYGMIDVLNGFLLPAWLRLEGMAPKTAGGILAFQVCVLILLAPIVGRIANQMRGKELLIGLGLYLAGWTFLSLPLGLSLPVQVSITLFIWVGATQFYGCGVNKRWYEHKSLMSVGTREMLLNVGRLSVGAVGISIMQLSPHNFPIIAGCLALLVGSWVIWVLQQLKKQAHAIEDKST